MSRRARNVRVVCVIMRVLTWNKDTSWIHVLMEEDEKVNLNIWIKITNISKQIDETM